MHRLRDVLANLWYLLLALLAIATATLVLYLPFTLGH